MLDALISGKLIKDIELKTSQNGKPYTNFLVIGTCWRTRKHRRVGHSLR